MPESQSAGAEVEQSRGERVATRLVLGAGLLALGVVGQHRMAESDVFWHLFQGRAVLRHMARVVPEPTAFPELARETRVAAWLWDVTAYLVQQAAGFTGLAWLTSLCAVLAGAAVLWMLRGTRANAPAAAFVLVGGIALTCLISRARARPEVAALLMLPLLTGALLRFARDPRRGVRWGVLAVVAMLLWAQLHGSFLLGLPIAAAVLGPALLASARDPGARRALLALGLGLLVASLTSSSGLELLGFGSEHAAADIKLHNAEMHAPLWGTFNPLQSVFGPLYPCLAVLGMYGAASGGRAVLAELLLLVLSAVIATQSVRFLTPATLLAAPLALHGASRLALQLRGRPARHLALAASCALVALVLYRGVSKTDHSIGPLGKTGLAEAQLPLAAAAYLARTPLGTRALSSYDAGGSLGFFLDGHARTFVDSRTMVLFDSLQFAVSRDSFRSRATFERAAARYRARVAVVPRDSDICRALAAPWQVVAVNPEWTTFSTLPGAAALHSIAPCGRDWLLPRACSAPGELGADLGRIRALRASPLLGFIDALALVSCRGDFAGAELRLPARADAGGFRPERDLIAAEIDVALHRGQGALDALREQAAQGDPSAWHVLRRALARGSPTSAELLPVAREAVELLDDQTPAELRALLAMLCIDRGDVECARFHGIRAALAGSSQGPALLRWLAAHHPDAEVRRDAAAWQAVLAAEPAAANRN